MEHNFSQETIEAYLNETLKGTALNDFEKALKSDAALRRKVELSEDLEKAFKHKALESAIAPTLKSLGEKYILNKEIQETEAIEKAPNTTNNKRWWVLGILLIALIASLWIWTQRSAASDNASNQIFATHFTPYSASEITRGGTETLGEGYENAVKHYNEGDYNAAIAVLKKELQTSPDDVRFQILLGSSYLSVKPIQSTAAISILKPLAADKAHLFTEAAQWYLALAFLQEGQKNLALPLLQTLADKKMGQYPTLAQQLLSEL